MMRSTVRRGAVVVLVVLFAACGSSRPTSPTATSALPTVPPPPSPTSPPAPPPQINFPPPAGPSRTFVFDRQLSYPVRDFTKQSRFVLYDNGAFELQYPPSQYGPGLFRGAYQRTNGVTMMLFEFQGRSIGTPWDDASGTLEGNSLTIRYHEIMQHADFENAVYVLMP